MLEKNYSPGEFEQRLYEGWEAAGAFAARPNSPAKPFTIMIPPPNVTGSLHMGHALTFTLQDVLIRWRRMQGYDALWQPGTDHAGIATQMVVERLLAAEGLNRQTLGREAFLARVWRWKEESGGSITRQLRRLGASLDWARERFTMDPGLSRAVREVFVRLYREGLIYRDRRLVNWDPELQSAISDLEVENREVKGHLWYIRYPIADAPERFIVVATTRPETMLGDVAIAVHPEDTRYADLVGRTAILPLVGRRIPIIADPHSDPEKGTGAVKITPAHDFNDFAVGVRHHLPMPSVLDRQACIDISEISGELVTIPGLAEPETVRALAGQDRFAARRAIVDALGRLGLLEKIEPHTHQVPHGDRSGAPIEPRLTTQWFCNAAELAKAAIAAVETGKTRFVPKQWENTFFAWMRDIQPWCISRQLWWGHRIPAWYGPDGQIFVAMEEAEAVALARAAYGKEVPLKQDEDVLDTWFSSALWPFSTLGWPEQTPDLQRYYPTDVLVTGFDIIFFWVARMMMMGLHFMGDVPFRTVCIHGLVRDERGQKMSKSRGNVIDPLELIEQYGADALRFAIAAATGPGRDIKLGAARVEGARNFVTKLWNAARFCEMHGVSGKTAFQPETARLPLCRWVLDAANRAIEDATAALEAYRFDEYAQVCYKFTWNTFCDWFLEFAKPALEDAAAAEEVRGTASYVLGTLLRLLHPIIPFVSEHLWDHFGFDEPLSLIRAPWPSACRVYQPDAARRDLDLIVRIISEVRSARNALHVPAKARFPLLIRNIIASGKRDLFAESILPFVEQICRLAGVSEVRIAEGAPPEQAAQIALAELEIVLPLAGVIDTKAEAARLAREAEALQRDIGKLDAKLTNADFLARAPAEVVEETKRRRDELDMEHARVKFAIRSLHATAD
ncbi:MAG: valine--tRNA ligase [Acetobacteraceae bacterium]|nr:valine--tRNA ligase [Acetobacteraceae bacterium]